MVPVPVAATNQGPAGGGGRAPGPAQLARTGDDSTGRQVGSPSGGPRNHTNYQPAGSGLAPRAHRPPTRSTAVCHQSGADRRSRWTETRARPSPTTIRFVAETVVPATNLTTNPTGATAPAPFPVCSHRPARATGLGVR